MCRLFMFIFPFLGSLVIRFTNFSHKIRLHSLNKPKADQFSHPQQMNWRKISNHLVLNKELLYKVRNIAKDSSFVAVFELIHLLF